MSTLHSPYFHASADLARECATCQADARESVHLIALQLWPASGVGPLSSDPSRSATEPLPATVQRATRWLDHINTILGISITVLVVVVAALQIAKAITHGGI